jgi:excisionase family DNA binding protein
MTVYEVAEKLGLSVSSLRAMAKRNRIGHYRIGPNDGRIRFTEEHLSAYLASCEVPVVSPSPATPKPPKPKRESLVQGADHFGRRKG